MQWIGISESGIIEFNSSIPFYFIEGTDWLLLTGAGTIAAFSFISVHTFDQIVRHQKNECVVPQAIHPK